MPSSVRIKAKKLSTELLQDPVIVANFRTLEDRVIALESIVSALTQDRAIAETDICPAVSTVAANLYPQLALAASGKRLVLIQCLPDFAKAGGYPLLKVSNAGGATASGRADVFRNDILISSSNVLTTATTLGGPIGVQMNIPTQVFTCLDAPPQGVHVYSFWFTPISGGLSSQNFKFRAEEI